MLADAWSQMQKKLHDNHRYSAHPDKKKGRAMSENLIKNVKAFYVTDDVSRVMPGVKDVKSVIINGKRKLETVSHNII